MNHFGDEEGLERLSSPVVRDEKAWVRAAILKAQERFLSAGQSWSSMSQRVFELIVRTDKPVGAYTLIELLSSSGERVYPATIYRAIAPLEALGLVHRIATLNAYVACTVAEPHHVSAFLLCEQCAGVIEMPSATSTVVSMACALGFVVRSAALEVRGTCARCAR